MVIEELKNNVAYRCPRCGITVSGIVSIFLLAGTKNMVKLKCDCTDDCTLNIAATPDNKLSVSVPCLACGGTHTFKISKEIFFTKEDFTLRCPYSGIDVFFLGSEENIERHLEESKADLVRLFEAAGMDDAECIFEPSENTGYTDRFIDRHIQDIVTYIIGELAEDGKINCACDDNKGDYVLDCFDDHLTLSCKKCGAKCDIALDNSVATNALISADSITLK